MRANVQADTGCEPGYHTIRVPRSAPCDPYLEINNLVTAYPSIAQAADGWDPSLITGHDYTVRSWKCPRHGHPYKETPARRVYGGYGCPYCGNRKIWVGFNDIATTHPGAATTLICCDPTKVTARVHGVGPRRARFRDRFPPPDFDTGSGPHIWSCGVEGHPPFEATAFQRVHDKECAHCDPPPRFQKHGFNTSKPGWVYLIEEPRLGLLQIGISNVPERRLAEHKGWEVLHVLGPMKGSHARAMEKAILNALWKNGGVSAASLNHKFDGYCESWQRESFPAKRITKLLGLAHWNETRSAARNASSKSG